MALEKYEALANITLSSAATTVTFSSISQAYRDLYLVISGTTVTSNATIDLRLNGDATTTNYSSVTIQGDGTSATTSSSNTFGLSSLSAASVSTCIVEFLDYTATNKHKSYLIRTGRPDSSTQFRVGRWANTAAVTTLGLVTGSTTYAAGTTFALYGVM